MSVNSKFSVYAGIASFLSPIFIFVLGLYISGVDTKIIDLKNSFIALDSKVFTHMTNHQMHVLRDDTISRSEYTLHCQEQERKNEDWKQMFKSTREEQKEQIDQLRIDIRNGYLRSYEK